MLQLTSLFEVAMLLLIPLIPAAVLYKVLSPKRRMRKATTPPPAAADGHAPLPAGTTEGEIGLDGVPHVKAQLRFRVVGATATYVVLLAVSILTYLYLGDLEQRKAELVAASMKDNQAWLVEAPVSFQDEAGNVVQEGGEMKQILVEVEPAEMTASANSVTFHVLTTNGKFPTARFSLTGLGMKSVVLDLNDSSKVRPDYPARKITGIEPVWIVLGKAYGAQLGSRATTSPESSALATTEHPR